MFEKDEEGFECCGAMSLGNKMFFVRFQGVCEKNLSSNQLIVVIVEKIQEDK